MGLINNYSNDTHVKILTDINKNVILNEYQATCAAKGLPSTATTMTKKVRNQQKYLLPFQHNISLKRWETNKNTYYLSNAISTPAGLHNEAQQTTLIPSQELPLWQHYHLHNQRTQILPHQQWTWHIKKHEQALLTDDWWHPAIKTTWFLKPK